MSNSNGSDNGEETPAVVGPVTIESAIVGVEPIPDIDLSYEPPIWSEMQLGRILMLLGAFGLFGVTLIASFCVAVWGSSDSWSRVTDLLNAIIPVETLIIGAAVSYYFKTGQK